MCLELLSAKESDQWQRLFSRQPFLTTQLLEHQQPRRLLSSGRGFSFHVSAPFCRLVRIATSRSHQQGAFAVGKRSTVPPADNAQTPRPTSATCVSRSVQQVATRITFSHSSPFLFGHQLSGYHLTNVRLSLKNIRGSLTLSTGRPDPRPDFVESSTTTAGFAPPRYVRTLLILIFCVVSSMGSVLFHILCHDTNS